MSEEKGSRKEIRTPMRMNLSADKAQSIPNLAQKLTPMAGGQDLICTNEEQTCRDTFHQNICVEGEVTTTIRARCDAKVFCLGGGLGTGCIGRVQPPPATCSFKFFENLCVEVDVVICADSMCDITGVVCAPPQEGPCDTTTTTTTTTSTTTTPPVTFTRPRPS